MLRFLLGALSLVGGLLWILLNLHAATAALDLAVGTVLAAGGLVLLMPHRIRLPRVVTAAVTAGFALAGTAAGLLVERSQAYGPNTYVIDRGFPFHWVQRGAVAVDTDTAHTIARSASRTIDLLSMTANLLIFGYVGLLLVVAVVLLRRSRGAK